MRRTARSRAESALAATPLTSAFSSAATPMACCSPSMLPPRDWACAFLIFHGGIFSVRASSPGLVELSDATRAAVRTPSAMASAMRTCGTPRSSAQRSISIEPARSPTSTRSATVKPVTSA